ncbi:hypothetical protein BFW01_g10698 [Lasiodiplodia theobromae]|uniref:Uncharacterized protein n=1 Tax=Lasiodiplodia theobromae TaxID=45133 RepID=A0A8H7M998_9PEZI|nr:hypothetical protein BFW01_g10698 [Lasiodiplodia theobromae]
MSSSRPRRTGPIRRSQYGYPVPPLELREALATKLQAIAQRGPQQENPAQAPEPLSDDEDAELEGEDSSSDDEAEGDESSASSSGASSPETSPVPSPTTAAPTTSALSQPAPAGLSSTWSTSVLAAPTSTFNPTNREEDDSDSDEPDEDPTGPALTRGPRPTGASGTAAAQLSSDTAAPSLSAPNGAEQSGEVWVMGGPPPPKPPSSGISQTTEHTLIAAGSIGATLLIVLIIWGVYTMRKKGLTFRDLVQMSRRSRGRPDRTYDIAKPAVHRMPAYMSEDKESMPLPQPPQVSYRPDSGQRDFFGGSFGLRPSTPQASTRTFLDDTTPPRNLSRAPSNARSSGSSSPTLLPLQSQQPSFLSRSNYDGSPPPSLPIQRSESYKSSQGQSRYSAERDDIVSPEAPGPTYQNFTTSRRFTAKKEPSYESRFSWTQSSQAPPTPIEPTTPHSVGRSSIAPTERSSVARFRTVDSWVGNQTGRIPSTQLREQPHWSYRQSTSTNGGLGQVDEGQPGWQPEIPASSVPTVPAVPSQYKPGGAAYHQRQNTSYSDQTVFRQHPGTEVKIPRGSLVPSEVLDAHMIPSAL